MRRLLMCSIAGLLMLGLLAGCAPGSRSPDVSTALSDDGPKLEIPAEASSTAPFASPSRQSAAMVVTDGPTRFYRVRPGVEQWLAVDAKARVITFGTSQGSEVAIYYVPKVGSRTPVDVGGLERPLSAPDPAVPTGGNQVTKRYLLDDLTAPGAGWIVVVPRTYDNGVGILGVRMSSRW